jgi:phosphotriesterase-related protein
LITKKLIKEEENAVLVGLVQKPQDERQVNEYLDELSFLALTAGTMFGAQSPSILVHEHVLVNFARAKYDPDAVFAIVKPKLDAVVRLGCSRFQDCTPNFIGRDSKLLMRLTDACGIEIWTNTGLYAARNHEYLPPYAKEETAEQLSRRWVEEARKGVDGV